MCGRLRRRTLIEPITEQPCRYREWDSQFFGRRIAEVVGHRLSGEQAASVLAWSAQHAIDCVYLLADSDDAETVRIAEDTGFRLVDVRLTLGRSVADLVSGRSRELAAMRPAVPEDLPALKAVAATGHRDSRFYYDGHFPRACCDALFETWIENSCNGYADAVLVLDVDGRAGGYVSCHLRGGGVGQIGLLGLARDLQGQAAGGHLLEASFIWFVDHGCREVIVATQARNCRAQRLYQRAGFVTRATQLWYHRWSRAGDPTAPLAGEPPGL